jgi:hypothetical protein
MNLTAIANKHLEVDTTKEVATISEEAVSGATTELQKTSPDTPYAATKGLLVARDAVYNDGVAKQEAARVAQTAVRSGGIGEVYDRIKAKNQAQDVRTAVSIGMESGAAPIDIVSAADTIRKQAPGMGITSTYQKDREIETRLSKDEIASTWLDRFANSVPTDIKKWLNQYKDQMVMGGMVVGGVGGTLAVTPAVVAGAIPTAGASTAGLALAGGIGATAGETLVKDFYQKLNQEEAPSFGEAALEVGKSLALNTTLEGAGIKLSRWVLEPAIASLASRETYKKLSSQVGDVLAYAMIASDRAGLKKAIAAVRGDSRVYRDFKSLVKTGDEQFVKTSREIIDELEAEMKAGKLSMTGEKITLRESPAETIIKATKGDDAFEEALDIPKAIIYDTGEIGDMARKAGQVRKGDEPFLAVSTDPYPIETLVEDVSDPVFDRIIKTSTFVDSLGGTLMRDVEHVMSAEERGIISSAVSFDSGTYRTSAGGWTDEATAQFNRGSVASIKAIFLSPANYLSKQVSNLAVDMVTAMNRIDKARVLWATKYNDAVWDTLSDSEAGLLSEALIRSTDRAQNLMHVEGGLAFRDSPTDVFYASQKVKDAYTRVRYLYEELYATKNAAAVTVYNQRGMKFLDDSLMVVPSTTTLSSGRANSIKKGLADKLVSDGSVDVNGKVWSKELAKSRSAFKIVDVTNPEAEVKWIFLTPEEQALRLKEIPESAQVLPRHEAFAHVNYKEEDNLYSVYEIALRDDGTHGINRVAGGKYEDEAINAARRLQDTADVGGIKSTYLAFNPRVTKNEIRAHYTPSFIESTKTMSERELDSFVTALHSSGKFKEEEVNAILAEVNSNRIPRGRGFAHRGDLRQRQAASIAKNAEGLANDIAQKQMAGELSADEIAAYTKAALKQAIAEAKPLTLVPGRTALARYASSIGKVDEDVWIKSVIDGFRNSKYGKYLDTDDWRADIITSGNPEALNLKSSPVSAKEANEARLIQKHLKKVLDIPTESQLRSEQAVIDMTARFARSDSVMQKELANMMRKGMRSGIVQSLGKSTRQTASQVFLGLINASLLVVQATTALNLSKNLFSNPKIIPLAVKDTADIIFGILGGKMGAEETYLLKAFRASGYLSGLDRSTIERAIANSSTSYGKLERLGIGMNTISMSMNTAGEAIGRIPLWAAARRELEEIYKANGKAHLIDTTQFFVDVSKKADTEFGAGNLTKFNQANWEQQNEWWNSITSGMMQFTGWGFHMAQYLNPFNKNHTLAEKMGLYTAFAGTFGLNSVPFFWDTVLLGESIGEEVWKGGSIHPGSLKDGVWNMSKSIAESRIGASIGVNTDAVYRAVTFGAPVALSDGVVNIANRVSLATQWSKFADGMQAQELAGPGIMLYFKGMKRAIETNYELGPFEIMRSLTQDIPGIRQKVNAYALTDANLKRISDGETMWDRFMIGTGFGVGTSVEENDLTMHIRNKKKWVQNFMYYEAKQTAKVFNSMGPDAAFEHAAKVNAILDNPLLTEKFFKSVQYQINYTNMTPSERTQYLINQSRAYNEIGTP